MKTVGVLGGGQLAWMLAIAAEGLGVPFWAGTDEAQAPVQQVASARVVSAVDTLLAQVEACLFENEWVDVTPLQSWVDRIDFLPALPTLGAMVDKFHQRQTMAALGLPIPAFRAVNTLAELAQAGRDLGYPLVLKSRRYGYDGKGTAIAPNETAAQQAWQAMGTPPAIAETYVPYQAELALIAARNAAGEMRFYPLAYTQQQDQVCRRIVLPSPYGEADQAQAIAAALLNHWQFVGVCGLEFFWEANGRLSVNEVAPRVHNSGHGTIEACVTSQFAQAIRIAAGLPLGDTALRVPAAVTVNLLGWETAPAHYPAQREAIAALPGTTLHWYGKPEARPGRKLGHATVVAENLAAAQALGDRLEALWYPA